MREPAGVDAVDGGREAFVPGEIIDGSLRLWRKPAGLAEITHEGTE